MSILTIAALLLASHTSVNPAAAASVVKVQANPVHVITGKRFVEPSSTKKTGALKHKEVTKPKPLPMPWKMHSGEMLSNVIERWAKHSGWHVEWLTNWDYPIDAGATMSGTVEEAVTTLLNLYKGGKHPLHAKFWLRQRLITITDLHAHGDNGDDQ